MATLSLPDGRLPPARTVPAASGAFATVQDAYLSVLLLAIAAYAMLGKGFAYAGVAPFYPGELLLAAGLVTLAWPRLSTAALCNAPALVLFVLMGWVLMRALPFVADDPMNALRDTVIVVYGLFAFITANLLLADPRRIARMVRWAGRFFTIYVFVSIPLFVLASAFEPVLPHWPGSADAQIVSIRRGEVAVHLAAATVFALVALKRNTLVWLIALLASIAFIAALSRGGMMAITVPVAVALVLTGRIVPFAATLALGLTAVAALYAADISFRIPSIDRAIDVRQIVENLVSIVGTSTSGSLDDNKTWRLEWWTRILNYTVFGDHFWTGKGFGPNLAVEDGFAGTASDVPKLRSPHNIHMTHLARGGVPGLLLWLLFVLTWSAMMVRAFLAARRDGERWWAGVFVVILAYALAAIVNGTFDVALEGPMVGIVFWVVIGAGMASAMSYRAMRTAPQGRADGTTLSAPPVATRL